MFYPGNKRGQITIFVIIALVIAAGIGTYIYIRSNTSAASNVSQELSPVFDYYRGCVAQEAQKALGLAGSQAGYISLPPYSSPSVYAPFSSRLNFIGLSIPYWEYVSGNGVIKEQAPTTAQIQKQIEDFLIQDVQQNCLFDDFYSRGWKITTGKPEIQVTINDNSVTVQEHMTLAVSNGNQSATKTDYSISVDSRFGSMLKTAQSLYSAEASSAFLENYTLDVIHLYAPVDGVEIGCSPKVWKSRDVEAQIKQGLEGNIQSLKYGSKNSYFNVPVSTNGESVSTLYSQNWPSRLDIAGADGELMKANSLGQQQGLGVLGFCYQPYHFVYSMMYPVLFQITDGNEIFQFPVVVRIKDNSIRGGYNISGLNETLDQDLCAASTQPVSVKLKDINLNPVDGQVSYSCFDQSCSLGNTTNGQVSGMIPACINGFLDVQAEGYAPAEVEYSSNNATSSAIVLDKLYSTNITLLVDNKPITSQTALISFDGKESATAALPGISSVDLSEGFYNVSVYVYGNSSINIPATTSRQCTTAPASGILGFLGQTQEQCYNVNIPATNIGSALVGGGQEEIYLLPEMLYSGNLTLNVKGLKSPKSLDELETNYALFQTQGVEVLR